MPIRLRLTLWYSGVLAVTLVAFGAILYFLLAQNLFHGAERTIQARADEVVRSLRVQAIEPGGRVAVILPPMDPFADSPDLFIQAVDYFGAVQVRSATLGNRFLPVTAGTMTAARRGVGVLERVSVGRQRLLLFNQPMFPGDPGTGVIQVGLPLNRITAVLERLRWLLLLTGAGGLVLAGTLGAWLARKALRPVDLFIRDAEAIGLSRDLSRRVADPGTRDEVGRLAGAFNEMLARLEAAHEQLAATLAAQRRFVADASHELRTPLTAIRTNAEVLRDAGPDVPQEEQAQALNDIVSEAERLSRLVSDLLTLARADAGQRLELVPMDPGPVMEDVHRQALLLARGHNLVLGEHDTGPVLGSADAVKQLLLILVDNALKYTPAGGTVRLSAGRQDGWVLLRVADTGQGIAPEDVPHLFDRFYRADRARTAGGAGLGLAIARWIAEEHGGRITVESAPGRGSTFIVWLPAGAASEPIPAPVEGYPGGGNG